MTFRKPSITIISSGLGVVNRGFESAALIWARALRKTNQAEIFLLSGGYHQESKQLICISQTSAFARGLRKLGLIHDGARLQQISIAPFVKTHLRQTRPDFVWLQEGSLAQILQPWLKNNLQGSKVVFCNGAPLGASYCSQFDLVINLIPQANDNLIEYGYPRSRTCLIPHPVEKATSVNSSHWRIMNGFIPSDKIVLSAAAWNSHHKRIDYVIKEIAIARKYDSRIKLLLCGAPSSETNDLKQLAFRLLGKSVRWMTLLHKEMCQAYNASDFFVLASNNEALGAVLIEAAIVGLPILTNTFPAAYYILGNDYPGILDLSRDGVLADALLSEAFTSSFPNISKSIEHRFSMSQLADQLLCFLSSNMHT